MMLYNKDKIDLDDCYNCYMLGILAKDETNFPNCGEEQSYITTMKGNNTSILFYLKALSYAPEPIINLIDIIPYSSPLYIGIDIHQTQAIFPISYVNLTIEKRKQIIEDKFSGKLILFRPKVIIKQRERDKKDIFYKNIEVKSIETDIDVFNNQEYVQVPKINILNNEFESKLMNQDFITFKDYPHVMKKPNYIMSNSFIYCTFGTWDKYIKNDKRNEWRYTGDCKDIRKIPINMESPEFASKFIRGTDNLIFIEKEYLTKSIDQLLYTNEALFITADERIENDVSQQETQHGEFLKEERDMSELCFLTRFKEYTVHEGLCYDDEDLINFHICVKTNPLTIVAGMSGTGKTQLARAYASMLDLSEEKNTLLFLPISPSYTEPGDVLGYLNNNNGLFIPSETRLTEFLNHAKVCDDQMHMVIFDEMNLSQVEHWFAPFISLLELKPEQRYLSLYSEKAHCINSTIYPSTLKIGSNIIFVGTVNVDETTKDFSDRLLDRANVITLKMRRFIELNEEQNDEKYQKKTNKETISHSKYATWVRDEKPLSAFSIDELQFFDSLNELIRKEDSQKGVSFRIVERIGKYLQNIPLDKNGNYLFSRKAAFDVQIKQRLMTKIRGTESQYKGLIGTTNNSSGNLESSLLFDFFSSVDAQKISEFHQTKAEILRKARELTIYGYAN